jgi:hypothetical protein
VAHVNSSFEEPKVGFCDAGRTLFSFMPKVTEKRRDVKLLPSYFALQWTQASLEKARADAMNFVGGCQRH